MNQIKESLEDSILKLSNCAICSDFIGPNIYQCNAGHTFCESCIKKVENCPTCRCSLPRGGIRARSLETVLEMIPLLECTHDDCNKKFKYNELKEHIDYCSKKCISCPIYGCCWDGKTENIEEHIRETHNDDIIKINDKQNDIIFCLKNTEGLLINAHTYQIIETESDSKLYLVVFWIIKGHFYTGSIIGTLISLDNKDNKSVSMSLEPIKFSYKLTASKKPWEVTIPLTEIQFSRHNFIIDQTLSLISGKYNPIYRASDQLHKNPMMEGLNLLIRIQFDGSIKQDFIEQELDFFEIEND